MFFDGNFKLNWVVRLSESDVALKAGFGRRGRQRRRLPRQTTQHTELLLKLEGTGKRAKENKISVEWRYKEQCCFKFPLKSEMLQNLWTIMMTCYIFNFFRLNRSNLSCRAQSRRSFGKCRRQGGCKVKELSLAYIILYCTVNKITHYFVKKCLLSI